MAAGWVCHAVDRIGECRAPCQIPLLPGLPTTIGGGDPRRVTRP